MPATRFMFTSESVNEGHPDKLADQVCARSSSNLGLLRSASPAGRAQQSSDCCLQVSDAVVDACFAQDPDSHVACETCTGTGFVMVFGEITTSAKVDYEQVVRDAIKEIGFDHPDKGLDYKTCEVLNKLHGPSSEIAAAVHGGDST